ncbi:MAG: lysophospholipase [Pseudomonadota bacterium]
MTSAILEPFTLRDGDTLALYEWQPDSAPAGLESPALNPRGQVLIVHGLGEHAMRYDHVATQLIEWGFAVRSYDQRGHGESVGARGAVPSEAALLYDLAEIVDDTRQRSRQDSADGKPLPLILLGHSMGGLISGRFVALGVRPVAGLVMSSPALDAGLSAFQRFKLRLGYRLAPDLCVGNGLDARYISHDEEVVRRYMTDRLVHSKISPRLASFITRAGPPTVAAAANWKVPTLLMYAGQDKLVSPNGSRAFARIAAASPAVKPGTVTAQCFEGLYHEIFNELEAEPVFGALKTWLDSRFPGAPGI